jgi:hypothetical protein
MHRGIVTQRVSYVKIERFCAFPGLQPGPPETRPFGTPDPEVGPNGMAFCPPGLALYPDLWSSVGLPVPPSYSTGSGFGSFMGSGRDVLIATEKVSGQSFGADMAGCVWQLQETTECIRLYRGQRLFALGVISAMTSTLAPSERPQ